MSIEPSVKLTLVATGDNTFDVNLEVSQGGNYGLAGVGFSVTGGVTDLRHELPSGVVPDSGLGLKGLIGFSADRNIYSNSDQSIWNLSAFQPIHGGATTVFGVGQVDGSLQMSIAATDILGGNDGRDAFDASLRVASGTFLGELPTLNWDPAFTVFNLYTPGSNQESTGEISLNLIDNRDQIFPFTPTEVSQEVPPVPIGGNQETPSRPAESSHVIPPEPVEVNQEDPPATVGVSKVDPSETDGRLEEIFLETTVVDRVKPRELVSLYSSLQGLEWASVDRVGQLSAIWQMETTYRPTAVLSSPILRSSTFFAGTQEPLMIDVSDRQNSILTPEPASVTLLAIGGLLSIRRRRGA